VSFADGAAAKLTHRMSRAFTVPTFHNWALYKSLDVCV
jgi:hypothetical protein